MADDGSWVDSISKHELVVALGQTADVVLVTDLAMNIVFASDGVRRVNGLEPEDVLGHSGLEYVHPEDVELVAMVATSTVEHGYRTRGATAPTRVLRADGEYHLIDVKGGPYIHEGEQRGFWMVGRRSARGEVYAEVLQRLLDEHPLSIALENVRELFPRAGERVAVASVPSASQDFVVGDRIPALLDGRDHREGSPWDRSATTGEYVVCDDLTELDVDSQKAAAREQFTSVMVMPVRGLDGATAALLTVWFSDGMPSAATATRAAEPVRDLVEAAMRIRTQFEDLRRTAHSDPLTGLANRLAFRESLLRQTLGAELAVLYIDLDGFKAVNDTHGHHAGDDLLRVVAQRLEDAVRPSDVVARLGGDEFALLCPDCDEAEARLIAERVRAMVEEPIVLDDITANVSASIGVAFAAGAADDVLRRADAALYEAKRGGRNTVRFDR